MYNECSRESISEREPEKIKCWEIRDAVMYTLYTENLIKFVELNLAYLYVGTK